MSHLTAADQDKIETLLQKKYTNKDIAVRPGRSPSTIGREILKGLDGNRNQKLNL
jgi:IS30 family transposase